MPSMTDSFPRGQGIPVDLRDIEDRAGKLWGPAAEQVGGPGRRKPQRHPHRAGQPGRRVSRSWPGTAVGRCWRPSSPGSLAGRSWCAGRTIPSAGSRPKSRHFATGRPRACRRSAPSGSCFMPGQMPSTCFPAPSGPLLEADLPLVLWWTGDPQKPRAALPRPGRRVLAAGPRPARPRCSGRCAPPGSRPGPLHVQPRQRLVRPGSLAGAGRAVLRPTVPPR